MTGCYQLFLIVLFFFDFYQRGSDLNCSTREDGEVESFQLFSNDIIADEHSHAHGTCPKNKSLSAGTKSTVQPQNPDIILPTSPKQLPSTSEFWFSLKAIPLSSFYKLHRVPSLTAMGENGQTYAHTIELPRSEPISNPEPLGSSSQNGSVHNKILEQVIRTPGRQPSPQPTHLCVPGSSQHRVLHEEGSGYVAPKFEGKELQMDQGISKLYRLVSLEY